MFNIQTLAIFSTLVAVNVVHSKSAELVSRINRASTDVTVEGWMRGETSIIGAHADEKNFFMEFVATGARFSFLGFQDFFDTFKDSAFEKTGWYNVTFYNFIEWEEDTRMYQTAQWILDGFDGGLYSFMSEKGLAKRARIGRFPANNTQLTFERKELCNKPDNICKSNSIRAPTTLKPWSWI